MWDKWSPRSLLPETRSRGVRVSPLLLYKCPDMPEIQVVPRKTYFFALRVMLSGRFVLEVRNMVCPFCKNPMEKGLLQIRQNTGMGEKETLFLTDSQTG